MVLLAEAVLISSSLSETDKLSSQFGKYPSF